MVRYFWTLLKANKGKIIVNTYWELAYVVNQTTIDSMVDTEQLYNIFINSMHGQIAFCCDCQPSSRTNVMFFSCSELVILFKNTHV